MTSTLTHGTPSLVRVSDIRKPGNTLLLASDQVRPHGCSRPVVLKSSDGKHATVPCFQWWCPQCGPKRRAELLARVDYGAAVERNTGGRVPMELCVTLPGHVDQKRHRLHEKQVYVYEQRAFRSLMTRLRLRAKRRGLGKVLYCRVREVQPKRGSLAPHLLVYGDLFHGMNKREREALLRECGFGFRHTWEPVRHRDGLVGYYAKYIMEHSALRVPKSARRYTYSPGFMPSATDWKLMRQVFAEYGWMLAEAAGAGFQDYEPNDDDFIDYRTGGIALGVSGHDRPVFLDTHHHWWLTPEWRAHREQRLARAEENKRYWRWLELGDQVNEIELPTWAFLGQYATAPAA